MSNKKQETKYMSFTEMSENGLIWKINTEILHPLGLALSRKPDGTSDGCIIAEDNYFEYDEKATLKHKQKYLDFANKITNIQKDKMNIITIPVIITFKKYMNSIVPQYIDQFITDTHYLYENTASLKTNLFSLLYNYTNAKNHSFFDENESKFEYKLQVEIREYKIIIDISVLRSLTLLDINLKVVDTDYNYNIIFTDHDKVESLGEYLSKTNLINKIYDTLVDLHLKENK